MTKYQINILSAISLLDSKNDNVDVEVIFDSGKKYVATFFTLKNIQSLMNRYKKSGECGSGLYFWASDLIIVENLTEQVIHQSIENLIKDNEFEQVFTQIE